MRAIHGYWKSDVFLPLIILLPETGPQIFRGRSTKFGWLDTSTGSTTAVTVSDVVSDVDTGQHTSGLLPLKPHWDFRRKSITSGGRGRRFVSMDTRTGHFFKSMHCPFLLSGVVQMPFSSETQCYTVLGSCKEQNAECKGIII